MISRINSLEILYFHAEQALLFKLIHAAARSSWAAATMACSAGMTSPHWRVFRPQSGFTHRRSAGMRWAAFCISCTMCACVGMLGEWMSYTPGPISLG